MRDEYGRFQEGNSGKPKGAVSKRTAAWKEAENAILNEQFDKFNRILSSLDGVEFCDMYLKVLNYFKPKKRAVDVDFTQEQPKKTFQIVIEGDEDNGKG